MFNEKKYYTYMALLTCMYMALPKNNFQFACILHKIYNNQSF